MSKVGGDMTRFRADKPAKLAMAMELFRENPTQPIKAVSAKLIAKWGSAVDHKDLSKLKKTVLKEKGKNDEADKAPISGDTLKGLCRDLACCINDHEAIQALQKAGVASFMVFIQNSKVLLDFERDIKERVSVSSC